MVYLSMHLMNLDLKELMIQMIWIRNNTKSHISVAMVNEKLF